MANQQEHAVMKSVVVTPRATEAFQPIPVRTGDRLVDRLLFALRTMLDLQLWTILAGIRPRLARMQGKLLDVGCGEMPFRRFVPRNVLYMGVDVPAAIDFGMGHHPEVTSFDGLSLPVADGSFDHILCTEVLEHAAEPDMLVAEMFRVLRPGGTLTLTVPFSARVHHAPHDYHRFTPYRLETLFARFDAVEITPRGNDVCVVANKLIVILIRQASSPARFLAALPVFALLLPMALVFTILAHLTLRFGGGSTEDPLGYLVVAERGGRRP
jgi:SAM-dependent methyltransferase